VMDSFMTIQNVTKPVKMGLYNQLIQVTTEHTCPCNLKKSLVFSQQTADIGILLCTQGNAYSPHFQKIHEHYL